jgi:hypothetical protein
VLPGEQLGVIHPGHAERLAVRPVPGGLVELWPLRADHRYDTTAPRPGWPRCCSAPVLIEIPNTGPGGPNRQERAHRGGAPQSPVKATEETSMLLRHTCLSVACDQCLDHPDQPGPHRHWPTEAAALDAVTALGWYVSEDGGRLLCPTCAPVLTCEAQGHEFTAWHRCGCSSQIAYRDCGRCGLEESRPTPPELRVVA